MKTSQSSFRDHLRMIWTITAKDMRDAIKNKTTLTVLVSALFLVVFYRLIPILTGSFEAPELIVADPGGSELVAELARSQAFQTYSRPDEAAMLKRAAVSEAPNLALAVPPGFDGMLAEGRAPELQGYTLYWVRADKGAELRQRAEAELARLAGRPVKIGTELLPIYPALGDNSLANWAVMSLVYILIMISLPLIPNLMLEEKQSHTLEALLVSPASAWDLAVGKGLTGIFYSLLTAAIILAAYSSQILQWGVILLVVLLGALFVAPLGLLVGGKVESRSQLSAGMWMIFIPLFAPALIIIPAEFFPPVVVQIARLLPTGALLSLAQSAFDQTVAPGRVLLEVGILLAWAIPLVILLVWSIRRIGRSGLLWPRATPATRAPQAEPAPVAVASRGREGFPALPVALPGLAGQPGRRNNLHIVLAIAAKDLREALRNKVMLMIILAALLMILLNSALPRLLRGRIEPQILVYDAGRSELTRALIRQSDLRIDLVRTQQELESALGDLPQTYLGLALPTDFDLRLAAGETVDLESYLIHWADRQVADRLASQFSAAVASQTPGAVRIAGEARIAYPASTGFGQSFMIAQILTVILLVIGLSLVPLLLVEEKEAHTLDVLLVSPARPGQVLAGKALAGSFFGLLAAAVVILLNRYLFVQWGVVALAILAGIAFAVALGLLIGALSNNPTTVGLWGGLVLMALVTAGLLSLFSNATWPAWLRELLNWLPSSILIRLVRLSMLGAAQLWIALGSAALLFGLAILFYALADLRLRRMVGG